MKSNALKIKDRAILIGYDPEGNCIYSEAISLSDYYDALHIWDAGENVKEMRLRRIKGYLFDSEGTLDQEFETFFDLKTGNFTSGTRKFSDGTVQDV